MIAVLASQQMKPDATVTVAEIIQQQWGEKRTDGVKVLPIKLSSAQKCILLNHGIKIDKQ